MCLREHVTAVYHMSVSKKQTLVYSTEPNTARSRFNTVIKDMMDLGRLRCVLSTRVSPAATTAAGLKNSACDVQIGKVPALDRQQMSKTYCK